MSALKRMSILCIHCRAYDAVVFRIYNLKRRVGSLIDTKAKIPYPFASDADTATYTISLTDTRLENIAI